ncbi:MAG TPA: type II toxin-antitoxin system HicB family antitoxin [Myxococcota bacterium]|nr:type II toxin-antitoxin system HicB family antitoxin [Myxococcota bacterium]
MATYIALLRKETGSDYGVSFPDFPGCVTAGRTLEEARRLAAEALAFHVEGMLEDGAKLPEPSEFDAIMAQPENADGVGLIVELPEPTSKAVRVNITLPKRVLAKIDAAARAARTSRSSFLAMAAEAQIRLASGRPRIWRSAKKASRRKATRRARA